MVLLVPTGTVGFATLIAGPKNADVVSVLPPRYFLADDLGVRTNYPAWLTLLVGICWTVALLRGRGTWNDAGRCCLLLGLALGTALVGPAPEAVSILLLYAVLFGVLAALAYAAWSIRRVAIFTLISAWLFTGLCGWAFLAPPGWLVLLVLPACWPLGAALERGWNGVRAGRPAGTPHPTR